MMSKDNRGMIENRVEAKKRGSTVAKVIDEKHKAKVAHKATKYQVKGMKQADAAALRKRIG